MLLLPVIALVLFTLITRYISVFGALAVIYALCAVACAADAYKRYPTDPDQARRETFVCCVILGVGFLIAGGWVYWKK